MFFILASFFAESQLYVSVNGSDRADGTKENPLATVHMAQRKARELRRLNDPQIANGIRIIVGDGTYSLHETLFIRPEDAGTAHSPTKIEAAAGATPVISGGVQIKGCFHSSRGSSYPCLVFEGFLIRCSRDLKFIGVEHIQTGLVRHMTFA